MCHIKGFEWNTLHDASCHSLRKSSFWWKNEILPFSEPFTCSRYRHVRFLESFSTSATKERLVPAGDRTGDPREVSASGRYAHWFHAKSAIPSFLRRAPSIAARPTQPFQPNGLDCAPRPDLDFACLEAPRRFRCTCNPRTTSHTDI